MAIGSIASNCAKTTHRPAQSADAQTGTQSTSGGNRSVRLVYWVVAIVGAWLLVWGLYELGQMMLRLIAFYD